MIVVIAGLIGGVIKQLLTPWDENTDLQQWLKNIVIGGAAAFLVYALIPLGVEDKELFAYSVIVGFAGVEVFQEIVDRYLRKDKLFGE